MPRKPTADGSPRDVRAEGRQATRRALLEVAVGLLEREGAQALSMRLIAQQAGCSTTVLYSHFGGKEGLAEALYLEGFARLYAALAAVQDPHPLERTVALNLRYRRFALEQGQFYALMFERPIPEFEVSPTSRAQAWQSMTPLLIALQSAVEQGRLRVPEPQPLAMQLWMTAHGVVSLERSGYLPPPLTDGAALLERMVRDLLAAHAP